MAHFSINEQYHASAVVAITASTSPVLALARNDNRGCFEVTISGSQTLYIGLGTAATSASFNEFMNHRDSYDNPYHKKEVYFTFSGNDAGTIAMITEYVRL